MYAPFSALLYCSPFSIAIHVTSSPAASQLISDIIDNQQAEEGFIIAYGICQELDDLKHLYHGLPDLLTRVVELELQRIPRALQYGLSIQKWTMMYMPQVESHCITSLSCK